MTDPQRKTTALSSPVHGRLGDAAQDLVTVHDPFGAASEAYRMLRTNLFYALIDSPPKIIVLTSASRGEGKSTTAANLGVTLAQADKNVLILDCDLRGPRLHSMFGVENTRGLVDILAGGGRIEEVWLEPMPGLKLICAGPPPPNPAELLSSRRLAEFLAEMRRRFDYVLVDTPPVGVSDSAVLAANGDGVLLVLDSQRTRKGALLQALHGLRGLGANVLGTVLNNFEGSGGGMTSYGYFQ
jgi:capsular exopolysaccharide synthesis family protein